MIHWITTVLALLGIYSIAGVLYSLWTAAPDQGRGGAEIWAVLMVIFTLAAFINEWRERNKKR